MNKKRFLYWITSITIALCLIVYIWVSNDEAYWLYTLLVVLLVFPNFTFKKMEKQKLMQIIIHYSQTGSVNEYLQQLKEYDRNMIKTNRIKYYQLITYAQAYMDKGSFTKAKEILDNLTEPAEKFNSLTKFLYYRAWINYFLNFGQVKEAKELLDQLKIMVEVSHASLQQQFIINYQLLLAKYNIRCDILLAETRATLNQVIDANPTPLMMASSSYYIGIVEYKLGKLAEAKKIFTEVASFNEQLHFVRKAKEYLIKIKETSTN